MNNDLISRSELKKALKSNCKPELCHDYNTAWCESCCRTNDFEDLIDNAPTVEPEKAKEGELVKAYTKGFDAGVETARPQGEWIDNECSICGRYETSQENFCATCGADMRGDNDDG